jgi:hypothetical protein
MVNFVSPNFLKMENNELKFYWYPDNNIDGVNFEMNKEYVVSEINRILNEKNSRQINGFFIHFGIPVGEVRFNRIIIERGTENIFILKEQTYFMYNYNKVGPVLTQELSFKPIVDYLNEIILRYDKYSDLKRAVNGIDKMTKNDEDEDE